MKVLEMEIASTDIDCEILEFCLRPAVTGLVEAYHISSKSIDGWKNTVNGIKCAGESTLVLNCTGSVFQSTNNQLTVKSIHQTSGQAWLQFFATNYVGHGKSVRCTSRLMPDILVNCELIVLY